MNPFEENREFPDWAHMTPAAADEALPRLLADAEKNLDAVENLADEPTWENTVHALRDATHPLWHAWGLVSHLLSVCNSEAWRAIEAKFLPRLVAFQLREAQSRKSYSKAKLMLARETDDVRKRILTKMVQSAEQSGVSLEGAKLERFNAIQARLADLAREFRDAVLDATKNYSLPLDGECRLEGLPEQIKAMVRKEDGSFAASIEDAVYVPFMQHCRDRNVREKLFVARATRAPENSGRIDEILALRQEMAEILGYADYNALSLSVKCAGNVSNAREMLSEIGRLAAPARAKENAELEKYAAAHGAETPLKPWDISFWAERMREELFSYSDEELSKYFNFPTVMKGLFNLTKRLFGVDIVEKTGTVPVWHEDVRFYEVRRNGAAIAHFYLDPYTRPATKQGGAWMNDFATRDVRAGKVISLPLAVMVCNQAKPDAGGKALMRLREVETIFHEFGHSLQHMLTAIDEPLCSGLSLIEWDAVELASQFMENWCTEPHALARFARNAESGEVIPADLVNKVIAARNYRAGAQTMRQLSFAEMDLLLHEKHDLKAHPHEAIQREVFDRLTPGSSIEGDLFLNAFSHIFAGGYASGYYSYKWSEVMSADAYEAFVEAGLGDDAAIAAVGRRYAATILANGGSKGAIDTFVSFRGAKPKVESLLRQQGLLK